MSNIWLFRFNPINKYLNTRNFDTRSTRLGLIALIFLAFFSVVLTSLKHAAHEVMPDPVQISLISTAIAISELAGSSSGFMGHHEVLNELYQQRASRNLMSCGSDQIQNCVMKNVDLRTAVGLARSSKGEAMLYLPKEDLGEITYHKLSYFLFGYSLSSLHLLFFVICGLSSLLFILQFTNSHIRLFFLLTFFMTLTFITNIIPDIGANVIHGRRCLAILGIIPAIHISFLIIDNLALSVRTLLFLTLQTMMLVFVLNVRSASVFILMNLLFVFAISVFQSRKQVYGKGPLYSPRVLVLVVLLVTFSCSKVYFYTWTSPTYTNHRTGHLFWHPFHIGLAAHPDAKTLYGIEFHDQPSFDFVSKVSDERFGSPDWQKYLNYNEFDEIIRDRLLSIFRDNPKFVIESFLLKIPIYFDVLWNVIIKPNASSFLLLIFGSILTGAALLRNVGNHVLTRLWPTCSLCAFSFLPSFILIPRADYSLVFTAQIICLLLVSVGIIIRRLV